MKPMRLSSYMLFAQKINGSGWSKRMIRRKFLLQVDKSDYAENERGQVLEHLYRLSTKKA